MERTRLSGKGQIIIPKGVRASHGWEPGEEFIVRDLGYGVLLIPSRPFPVTRLEDVVGCTGYVGPVRSLEEMDAGISRGASRGG